MARIRSVHPGLFTDEAWVSCSAMARLLVIGIWTEADDQGVFEWKPLQLKMRLLPADAANVAELLEEIRKAGLVMGYEVEGRHYGAIRNFRKFQRPQKPNALHPLPEIAAAYVGLSATDPEPVRDQYATDPGKSPQMEDGGGKGEENSEPNGSSLPKPARPKATKRCPSDWTPSEADFEAVASEGFSPGELERELSKIRDHEFRTAHSDWSAVYRNWIRRASESRKPRHERPHQDRQPSPRNDRLGRMLAGAMAAADG